MTPTDLLSYLSVSQVHILTSSCTQHVHADTQHIQALLHIWAATKNTRLCTHQLQPHTNADTLHRGVHTHSYIYQPLPHTRAETTPTITPNTCVGTTQ